MNVAFDLEVLDISSSLLGVGYSVLMLLLVLDNIDFIDILSFSRLACSRYN